MKSGSETNGYIAAHSDHTYSIRPACEIGGLALCADPGHCTIEGHDGNLFNVYEDGNPDPLDWQACLTDQEAEHLGGHHARRGAARLRAARLAGLRRWSSSHPRAGRWSTSTRTSTRPTPTPTTQTVTLIGQPVTIEATPTQYRWHFGSGDDGDLTTTDPGAAYPDLRVTYRYLRVGTVQPSVDTTYAGRYRVGNGPWRTIPNTLTVPGAPVDLQVVSATPHLVGY